ncbi:ABC transporter permease [bacterium]|nr:ABC transporter permease [bacterium]
MIEIVGVRKTYQMGETALDVLKGVSLCIEDGEFVAIMGPSGSGKSTLMNILGLLDVPSEGSYKFNDIETAKMNEDQLAVLRRQEIGFIFQQFNLLARMSASENVSMPLLYSKQGAGSERADELLKEVGLADRTHHRPNELSGGQQQRVAIARALINSPHMILADEPTGNLDSKSEKEIMAILKKLNAEGITVVIVTHEEEIGKQARRLVRMRDGMILSDERLENEKKLQIAKSPLQITKSNFLKDFGIYFKQGFKTLLANKVRTALSMLGVLIGVASVVSIMALGKGAEAEIKKSLESLGTNILRVRANYMGYGNKSYWLRHEDMSVLKERIASIKSISAVVREQAKATYGSSDYDATIQGVASTWAKMHASEPEKGRFFTEEENVDRARVAVIGDEVKKQLFGEQNAIGEMIKVNNVIFQVIGVFPARGSGFSNLDSMIMAPLQTVMHRIAGPAWVDYIEVEADSVENSTEIQESVVAVLNSTHRVPEDKQDKAYTVDNSADVLQIMQTTIGAVSALLSAIAAISLLVGGIGIMNIMLVSVTERTKEIGLRKAVGARGPDILSQFLSESVVVSVVGGLIGVALAGTVSLMVNLISGWKTAITLNSVLMAVIFSTVIGIIFGVYPARKASKLNPIDALRSD